MTFLQKLILPVILTVPMILYCQEAAEVEKLHKLEIGADFTMGGTERGNHFGGGLKLGFNIKNYLVAGPIIRYNRVNFLKVSYGGENAFNSYGGGGFMEMRFAKILFLGLEVNAITSPFKLKEVFTGTVDLSKELWTVSAFVSGGLSINIKDRIRLNACISYDVINRGNSPFILSYPVYEGGGVYKPIPIMYRLGVNIPLMRK